MSHHLRSWLYNSMARFSASAAMADITSAFFSTMRPTSTGVRTRFPSK